MKTELSKIMPGIFFLKISGIFILLLLLTASSFGGIKKPTYQVGSLIFFEKGAAG